MVWQRRRGIILMLGVCVVASLSMAATTYQYLHRLPDPLEADREGLFRWLVTRHVADESAETRGKLITRLEQELHQGVDLDDVQRQLTAEQQTLFWQNVEHLVEEWFRIKAALFERTPKTEQAGLVDRQIDAISTSGVIQRLVARDLPESKTPPSPLELLARFDQMTIEWINRSPLDERARVQQFAEVVKARLMLRALGSLRDALVPGDASP